MVATKDNRNEEEPSFSDDEDFVDEITNEELLPDLMATEPRLDKSNDRIVVIDNIPKVGQEKKEKLKQIINKLLTNYGTIINEYFPEDEKGVTKGYMFVEFSNEQSASDAHAYLQNYALDKNHIFKTNLFNDLESYLNLDLSQRNDDPAPYNDPGNLTWWLTSTDCHGHDQFAVQHGDNYTSVCLNTPLQQQPQVLESREKWTPTRFEWSPRGTYLATFHDKGIALWAGEKFKQFMRFNHPGVVYIHFSPCEKYLVTFNPHLAGVNDQALIIWDTRTGQKKRNFSCDRSNIPWPFFKWNYDDSYFAKLSADTLFVYETQTFSLLNKKSIKIPHIKDFEWSPANNYIAYWVAQVKDVPARVVLLDIPSKNEIRSKNLVNVAECKIYWQSNGDFVCVRVDRYKKLNVVKEDDKDAIKYSGIYHNFEIFRIREKQIPVDSIEVKESFQAFAWEPSGQKFCIIFSEGQNKNTAAFYRIVNASGISPGKIEPIKEIKNKNFTTIFWAPQTLGSYCVLASIGPKCQGVPTAEFYDVSNSVQLLNKIEHDHMSDIEWDPTGRYLITYVSYWHFKAENAYILWSFQGKQLQKVNYDKLFKFIWRPRPPTLLTEEHKKEIIKNFKSYQERFNEIDMHKRHAISKEILEERRKLMKDFNMFRSMSSQRYDEQRERRLELRNGYDTDNLINDDEQIDYTVQFLVETKKEEVSE